MRNRDFRFRIRRQLMKGKLIGKKEAVSNLVDPGDEFFKEAQRRQGPFDRDDGSANPHVVRHFRPLMDKNVALGQHGWQMREAFSHDAIRVHE